MFNDRNSHDFTRFGLSHLGTADDGGPFLPLLSWNVKGSGLGLWPLGNRWLNRCWHLFGIEFKKHALSPEETGIHPLGIGCPSGVEKAGRNLLKYHK
jgi:hypothetical protein